MVASLAEVKYNIPDSLKKYIGDNTLTVRSPGRINLIGEHTDYNNGFVLPAAIDKAAYLAVTPRTDNEIHLHSVDLHDVYITSVDSIAKSTVSWPNYLLGVVEQFKLAGILITGFNAALTADIPIGAGLSSSAAVECAMALALNVLFAANFDKLTLVKMAQKAEHDFAGVQCGIMDQFASMFGKKNHVIRLDCRSLEYVYEPLNMDGIKIVLLDTNIKHSLASSEYNVRRKQCETGVAIVQQHNADVKSLRDINMEMLNSYVLPIDQVVYNRCKYVVEEYNRLLDACCDLEQGNLTAFGSRMFETHYGLSNLYEVSCAELDFLVAHVKQNPAVLGARMMGGGFGGCTINLVKEEAVDDLIEQTAKVYRQQMHHELKAYIAKIEDGSNIVR
ncbi:MAG TPA: galactokinase [Panacibacter sp.]|nr:galactokinase [Panacibacter sp.]